MKKFLSIKNLSICLAVLCLLLVFAFSFVTEFHVYNSVSNHSYLNIIWGCDAIKDNTDGTISRFSPGNEISASVFGLIGTAVALISGIFTIVFALAGKRMFKNERDLKIAMFVMGGLVIVGGVFSFFALEGFFISYSKLLGTTVEDMKDLFKQSGAVMSCPFQIVNGVLGVAAGGLVIGSQFMPEKSLIK